MAKGFAHGLAHGQGRLSSGGFGAAGVFVVTLVSLYSPKFGTSSAAATTLVVGVIATPIFKNYLHLEAPFVFAIALCFVTFFVVTTFENLVGSFKRTYKDREPLEMSTENLFQTTSETSETIYSRNNAIVSIEQIEKSTLG